MSKPKTGTKYTFDAPDALGAMHMTEDARETRRLAVDPTVKDEDPKAAKEQRDMHEQDMHPGTEVTVFGYDDDRDLILLEWTDGIGTSRITSVDPEFFADHFSGA